MIYIYIYSIINNPINTFGTFICIEDAEFGSVTVSSITVLPVASIPVTRLGGLAVLLVVLLSKPI